MMTPAESRDFAVARAIVSAARAGGRRALSEPDAKTLLRSAGIGTPRGAVARNAGEARALAGRLAPPLALKIVSPGLLHKGDVGGVELNVGGGDLAEAAYDRLMRRAKERLPGIALDGVLVEEMVTGGVEAVASVSRDPALGWVLMAGLGGLWVELIRDVSFRLIPVERADVAEMLDELRAAPLLRGGRGRAAVDRGALVEALVALAALAETLSEDLAEVEINPLAVLPRGVSAIDAVIRLQGPA